MKRTASIVAAVLVTALFSQTAFAALAVPGRKRTFVNDYANVMDAGAKKELEATLKDFKKRHPKMEIVVTVMPSLEGMTMDTFLHETAFKWRRLWPFPNESRVHYIVAVKEHTMRIGVSHTLEQVLTTEVSQDIVKNVAFPAFKNGDYTTGIREGVRRIVDILEPMKYVKNTYVLSYN
jgi:uncharacterized protein